MTSLRTRLLSLSAAHLRLLSLLALALPGGAHALQVVTTTPGLAALAKEVAGDHAEVTSLSRGVQDPHFVDANPTLAVKLRRADLLIDNGLDLEIGWLPPLVNQSRNPDIQPNGPRRLTAASFVKVRDIPTGPVDRSLGDLHAAGNPHFIADPHAAKAIAAGIAAKLAQLDPANAASYAQRAADLQRRLDADLARWDAAWKAVQGRKIVAQHQTLSYLLAWSGLSAAAYLEPKPGIPPPPSHLAEVVQLVRADGIKAIVLENFYDPRSAQVVAQHTGAKVVLIPGDVGGEPGLDTYEKYIDRLVELIASAVR
jgi:zinc/manganese transport system substrate-binding protein